MNIGIYIYDQAEVLDFSGPFEVFTTASRVSDEDEPFSVFLIAEKDGPVTARAGYQVLPNATIDNHPPIDVLIIVGGVHTGEMANEKVKAWIAHQAAIVQQVATVCTGIFLVVA